MVEMHDAPEFMGKRSNPIRSLPRIAHDDADLRTELDDGLREWLIEACAARRGSFR
jgi:hypothetical protein